MVAHLLGHRGDVVDQAHRAHEVAAFEVLGDGLALARPALGVLQRAPDLLFAQTCHRSLHANRFPGAVVHRDAVRARPRGQHRGGNARVDHPPAAADLPHLTRSVIPEGLSAAEIDAAVRDHVARGKALYELDEETLAAPGPGADRDPGGVRRVRRLLRRRPGGGRPAALPARGDLAGPHHHRRDAGRRAAAGRGRRRARRGRAAGGGRRRAAGRRPGRGGLRRPDLGPGPGVAGPRVHRRPLGAADDRDGRRRRRARAGRREVPHRRVGRGRGRRARGHRLHALRLRHRAGRGRRPWSTPTGWPRWAPGWRPWTPPPTSRAPARGWWTASS